MSKNDNIHFRVSKEEKEMVEFMAERRGLKVAQYLLMLAKQDFNNDELLKYARKLPTELQSDLNEEK